MKKLLVLSVISTLALAAPAHAQLFNSGNSGLVGVANNLLGVQTGHISVLNGGILNGSNVLSGIGLGSTAYAGNSSTNTTGSGHAVIPGNSGTITSGRGNMVIPGNGNTVVPGSGNVVGTGNVVGAGNMVGNQWGSNFTNRSFNSRSW
jgi:hypothetical protein